MDVIRLGLPYNTSYLPDAMVEGYSSMIWTERFRTPGQFELKTQLVDETMAFLPEMTFITHRDTLNVMMVEDHAISENEQGIRELTVTGRSVDAFLENRWIEGAYQKKRLMRKNYPAYGAVAVLIWNVVANGSGKDVTRGDPDPFTDYMTKPGQTVPDVPEQNDFAWNLQDKIPNVVVTDSTTVTLSGRRWWVTEGLLYEQLMKILEDTDLAVRVIRPHPLSEGVVMAVKTNLEERGDITRSPREQMTQLRFDMYNGIDRTIAQNVNPRVEFNYLHGHFKSSSYLYSIKEYKTAVEVMSSGLAIPDVYRNANEAEFTAWKRRVDGMDASSPEIPPEPEKPDELRKNASKEEREARADKMDKWLDNHKKWRNKRDRILSDFKADSIEDARKLLQSKRKVSLFQGDISPLAPYKYGEDYYLGDSVTLHGDYGEVERMVVSEYVRTEDATGDSGFPTLSTP